MCFVAHLLQRVALHQPQSLLPLSPLSFGSPARNLMPQGMVSSVPGGEVVGSASETTRQASLDVTRPHVQMTGSVDESLTKTDERQTCGLFDLWNY